MKLAKENPECLNYNVVSSIDGEDNWFNIVMFDPTIGYFDSEDEEFMILTDLDDEDRTGLTNNSICIN